MWKNTIEKEVTIKACTQYNLDFFLGFFSILLLFVIIFTFFSSFFIFFIQSSFTFIFFCYSIFPKNIFLIF
jgi:hypothetical protein